MKRKIFCVLSTCHTTITVGNYFSFVLKIYGTVDLWAVALPQSYVTSIPFLLPWNLCHTFFLDFNRDLNWLIVDHFYQKYGVHNSRKYRTHQQWPWQVDFQPNLNEQGLFKSKV
jgi:hypothetical protein